MKKIQCRRLQRKRMRPTDVLHRREEKIVLKFSQDQKPKASEHAR